MTLFCCARCDFFLFFLVFGICNKEKKRKRKADNVNVIREKIFSIVEMVSLLGDCLGEDFGGIVVEWGWWKCRRRKYASTNVGRDEICVFGHVFLFGNVDDCEEFFSLSPSPSSSPPPSSPLPQDVSIYTPKPPPLPKEKKRYTN